ncbi:MAG: flagellar protein FlgN [Lachnospiraceae bacterium]|nr:flagellar protein FlgN [Lachnospiraceae bacterium]MCR4731779.1 flagellar protein FlgN [Lachnospiraceae bacterium]
MASLVEELVSVMQQEKDGYDRLFELSDQKREAIVKRRLQRLEELNTLEEGVASDLKNLENKRTRCLQDMSAVLGHDREILTVTQIIDLLEKQPAEQEQLQESKNALVASATRMRQLNEQIQVLLKQALEMTEFDLTLFRSLKGAPETANYNKNAYNTGDVLPSSGFDAKQ